ncbi:hypothetical protein GN958_ATG09798, partial [Phytophthora infestans]
PRPQLHHANQAHRHLGACPRLPRPVDVEAARGVKNATFDGVIDITSSASSSVAWAMSVHLLAPSLLCPKCTTSMRLDVEHERWRCSRGEKLWSSRFRSSWLQERIHETSNELLLSAQTDSTITFEIPVLSEQEFDSFDDAELALHTWNKRHGLDVTRAHNNKNKLKVIRQRDYQCDR